MSGFPWPPGEVFGEGREAGAQTLHPGQCWGRNFLILPAELSECQGKLQELHRLLQSLESLHRIPSAPVIPTHQASVTTERPKKGKRTSRMWCTQSFAKDDTIGRVGRLHGSVPNLSRYLESRDHSGPRGLPPPDYAHLQRSFWALAQKGECMTEGDEEQAGGGGEEEESDGPPLPPQCTAPSAASWLPSLPNGTN